MIKIKELLKFLAERLAPANSSKMIDTTQVQSRT
jgi:hypothetical protein